MLRTSEQPLTSIPDQITIDRMPGEDATTYQKRQKEPFSHKIAQQTDRTVRVFIRPWPKGHVHEGWELFGDIVEAMLRFCYWMIALFVRSIISFLQLCARGLGLGAKNLAHGKMKERASLIIGWFLLIIVLSTAISGIAIAKGWAAPFLNYLPFRSSGIHQSERPLLPTFPANACESTGAACAAATIYLDGAPSISSDRILNVLQSYHSPAATPAFAQGLYALGVKYGINPAYALGFFVEESQCGTQGIAIQTLSLGNIRFTQSDSPIGYGNIRGFRSYASWLDGAEDWFWVIRTYYMNQNIRAISDVTPIYAPSSDNNNPVTYAHDVYQFVQTWAKP